MAKKKARRRGRGITVADVERWKRDKVRAQARLDDAAVFLRGVDIELERIEQQKESILARIQPMERKRDEAKAKIAYYEKNLNRFERIAYAKKRLAEEERKLASMEAVERERLHGRNTVQNGGA